MSLDEGLLKTLNQDWASTQMDIVMVVFSVLGLTIIWLTAAIPLWLRNQKRTAVQLVLLIIIIDLIVLITKLLVARERPDDIRIVIPPPLDYSFPSGHAARAFGAFLLISLATKKRVIIPALFLYVFMIAISRVYLGVHYPSDILGGAFLGLAMAYVFVRASKTTTFKSFIDRIIVGLEGLKKFFVR